MIAQTSRHGFLVKFSQNLANIKVFLDMPAPLPKANELADRVAQMGQNAVIDEVALRRIAAEARKLLSVDAANAHGVLGRVAALRWNVVELKRHFDSAISLGDPVLSRCNYSTALFLVGEAEQSFKMVHEAWRRAPDSLLVLDELITSAIHVAHFEEAQALCDHRRKLAPERDLPIARVVTELANAVNQGAFSEAGACEALRAADSARSDARIRPNGIRVVPSLDEPGSFLFEYRLIASPTVAGELNEALSLRWAESPKAMADPGLNFLPMFIGTVINGSHT